MLKFSSSSPLSQPLIPVLSTVLHFTPDEAAHLKEKVTQQGSVMGRLGIFG